MVAAERRVLAEIIKLVREGDFAKAELRNRQLGRRVLPGPTCPGLRRRRRRKKKGRRSSSIDSINLLYR